MKILNDQFYTKPTVAKQCITLINNLSSFDTIIEPSAGQGSFSSKIDNCLAFDLDPKKDEIIKQDFLQLRKSKTWGERILFIGNPPFGSRSTLAKKFIKHAISLGATSIAFILPDVFSKTTNQKDNLFPLDWKLVVEHKLEDDSFEIIQDGFIKTYHVPCTFYVWTRDQVELNLRKWPPNRPTEFSFLKRGDNTADFVINGNSGKVKTIKEVTNSKSEHYIRVSNGSNIKNIKSCFCKLNFEKRSSVNGGNFWINQDDISLAWYNFMKEKAAI